MELDARSIKMSGVRQAGVTYEGRTEKGELVFKFMELYPLRFEHES